MIMNDDKQTTMGKNSKTEQNQENIIIVIFKSVIKLATSYDPDQIFIYSIIISFLGVIESHIQI